jgi:hypothetical protein
LSDVRTTNPAAPEVHQRAFPREIAEKIYMRLIEARRTLVEEHSANFRWLLASFLALNSGGLFGVAQVDETKPWVAIAALCFWVGIAATLGNAWYSQIQTRKFIQAQEKLERFWMMVASNGLIDEMEGDRLEKERNTVSGEWGRWIGLLSFLAFSLGLLMTFFGI